MGITATQRRIIALAKKNGKGWYCRGFYIRDESHSCPMTKAAGMQGTQDTPEAAASLGVTEHTRLAIVRAADADSPYNLTLRNYMLKNLVGV